MNLSSQKSAIALSASAAALLMPVSAFAEDGAAGADILIPKMAEFIPALIAFLVIWIILAKLAWPQIIGMMDKRQEKIQSDLDAAEQSRIEAAQSVKDSEGEIVMARHEAEEIIAKAKKEAEERAKNAPVQVNVVRREKKQRPHKSR